ncbi:MAG: class I SAM-dependent methyltransferase [Candidatus Heimdallarchaeota archaeon]
MDHHHNKHEWTEERSKRFIRLVKEKVYKSRYIPFARKIVYFMEKYKIDLNSTIVDIGCGPGYLLIEIRKILPDIKIIGVDASDLMINTAIEKAKELNIKNFEFKKAYAENIPIQNSLIDLSTCYNSLHDFKDWKLAIKEIFRILKPNGIFILLDRSGAYPKWKFFSVIFRIGLRNAIRYFKTRHSWLDPKIIEKLIIDVGFQVLFLEKKEHYIIVCKKSNK